MVNMGNNNGGSKMQIARPIINFCKKLTLLIAISLLSGCCLGLVIRTVSDDANSKFMGQTYYLFITSAPKKKVNEANPVLAEELRNAGETDPIALLKKRGFRCKVGSTTVCTDKITFNTSSKKCDGRGFVPIETFSHDLTLTFTTNDGKPTLTDVELRNPDVGRTKQKSVVGSLEQPQQC